MAEVSKVNFGESLGKVVKGGRVVSASGSETSVSSSMPTSAIIYDAYTSIIKKKKFKKSTALSIFGFCKSISAVFIPKNIRQNLIFERNYLKIGFQWEKRCNTVNI